MAPAPAAGRGAHAPQAFGFNTPSPDEVARAAGPAGGEWRLPPLLLLALLLASQQPTAVHAVHLPALVCSSVLLPGGRWTDAAAAMPCPLPRMQPVPQQASSSPPPRPPPTSSSSSN